MTKKNIITKRIVFFLEYIIMKPCLKKKGKKLLIEVFPPSFYIRLYNLHIIWHLS